MPMHSEQKPDGSWTHYSDKEWSDKNAAEIGGIFNIIAWTWPGVVLMIVTFFLTTHFPKRDDQYGYMWAVFFTVNIPYWIWRASRRR